MTLAVTNRTVTPAPTVRELLDQAKAVEHHDANASRILVQQARVLARSQNDEAGEAEAFYRLASLAYYTGQADEAFGVAVDARDLARKCGAVVVEVWALNLMGIVPYVGPILALVGIVLSLVLVFKDEQRRSVFDRVGGTLVVNRR